MSQFKGMGAVPISGTESFGFRVWAPNADAVFVTGNFCGWRKDEHPLSREGESGYWAGVVPGVGNGALYKYVIHHRNQELWRVDAYARDVQESSVQGVDGVVTSPSSAQWAPFATPRFDDLILYQLHLGSFAGYNDGIEVKHVSNGMPAATCEQVICKLEYIRDLGFNALALLPLGEHPRHADQSHMGYAPTNWFAPESDFGSPASVRRFVDEAHRQGIAVIFDVVYNHASIDQNYYWEYDGETREGGIYFEGGLDSQFGRVPAHWKEEVRRFFLDNARMWLDDYRGDGLRFDAAHLVQEESLRFILNGLRDNPYWRDKLMIAEWTGDDRHHWPSVINDTGFNSVWGMAGPYGFREAISRGAFGGDAVEAVRSVMELHPYANHWNVVRYFLGSHDQIRDRKSGSEPDHRYPVEKLGGRDSWTARAQCRMGWVMSVAAPGVPMMFMGCEGHLPGYWWPTLDNNPVHRDHRMDWSKIGDPVGEPMKRLVRDANQMRWHHPALRSHSLDVCHLDHDSNVMAFRRWDQNGDVVLTVANFSENEWPDFNYWVRTGCGGRFQEILNTQAPIYDGYPDSGNGPNARECNADGWMSIRLPKWSVLCFRKVG